MKPVYEISIAGKVIDFGGRLVALRLVQDRDRLAPIGSDSVEIVLDDTREGARLSIPPRGRALRVKIGYEGIPLVDKGIFIVDETEIEGPPDTLTIRAQNNPKTPHSDSFNPMTTRFSRSWPAPQTIQDVVTKIAIDHGLFPQVSPSLAGIALPHIDQTDMGDDELLNRYVCRVYDAFYLVQDSRLIVAKNGSGQTASDAEMPLVHVRKADVGEKLDPAKIYLSSWRARFSDFQRYNTVRAAWRDVAAAKDVDETVGDGTTPVLRLPFTFPTKNAAHSAAQTAFNRCNASVGGLSVTFPGAPQLFAGGIIVAENLHPDLENGGMQTRWYCRSVTHTLDGAGLITEAEGERLTADLTSDLANNA